MPAHQSYAKNKQHIYNYRINHPDKIKLMRVSSNRRGYIWRKIKLEFMNILII